MPPVGEVTEDDQACLRAWVNQVAQTHGDTNEIPFQPLEVSSALRKVKTLLQGDVPTPEEIAQVTGDAQTLRGLVEGWASGPAFERKLSHFLQVSLQQSALIENIEQFDRLQRHPSYNIPLRRVLEESFVRTALEIVNRGDPFTEVTTTRRWMMTTANLLLLLYPDQTLQDRQQQHTLTPNLDEVPDELSEQIQRRIWYIPELPQPCIMRSENFLDTLFGLIPRVRCPGLSQAIRFSNGLLTPSDFEDWRMVEISTLPEGSIQQPTPYYDLETLRGADQIETRLPRLGFFTTSVFLNNWVTNTDNQFRVTVNQALLTALHVGFASSEPTEPLSLSGLDEAHAMPGTDCYGCHR